MVQEFSCHQRLEEDRSYGYKLLVLQDSRNRWISNYLAPRCLPMGCGYSLLFISVQALFCARGQSRGRKDVIRSRLEVTITKGITHFIILSDGFGHC